VGVGGTLDVVLTLFPAQKDATYSISSPVVAATDTTLLGLIVTGTVSIVAVTAKTATTMTIRLRNTGTAAASVPVGAVTAVAVAGT